MGTRVLSVGVPGDGDGDRLVRVCAHCARGQAGAVAMLILNLDGERGVEVELDGIGGRRIAEYEVSAAELSSARVSLNGRVLRVDADGSPPPLGGRSREGKNAVVGPHRYAFAVIADANAPACR